MQMKKWTLVALLLSASLAGCADCGTKPNTVKTSGDPKFVEDNGQGGVNLSTDLTIDFGPVLVGSRNERKVLIRNDGRGDLTIDAVNRGEGFDESFRYQFETFTIAAGESHEVSFFFEPNEAGDKTSEVALSVKDATLDSMPIHLKGRAVTGGCVLDPADVADFGQVAVGTSYVKLISVKNSSELDWDVTIGNITSQSDQGAFAFAMGFVPGTYKVPAHDAVVVPIEFKPNHNGAHSAFLAIPAPSMCQPAVMPLNGNGVDQVLVWEPNPLDFGFVNPNTPITKSVTFKNLGNKDIVVSQLAVENPPNKDEFALAGTETQFVVPKNGGTYKIDVVFKPTLLGSQTGKLNFATDDAKLNKGFVSLKGYGGGPDIDVTPTKVDFGPVAIGTYQYRRITIGNVGTDISGTTDDNLLLGKPDASGKYVETAAGKLAELKIDVGDKTEFTFDPVVQGYATSGIAATQSVDLRVKFTPTSPGQKEATVTIFSNDPDEPEVKVKVVAGGKTMPPCDYEIIPPQLPFGVVENGKSITKPFFIKNKATNPSEECLISTLGFGRGTSGAFSLPKGPVQGQTIAGGDTYEVPVKFAPTADGTYNGTVEFYISSPTAPEGKVTLTGASQAPCLLIAPNDLDFGVVQTNCSSRDRTFTVYNVCSSNVSITGIDLQAGLSTEFKIKSKPALPKTLAPGDSVDFVAVYHPTDVGNDSGSIAVQTAQLSQPYVVTFQGRGATTAIQTDVFAQDPLPKADVLLVIDDSGSMYDKQNSLSQNFASFIKFAVSQQVDYHIGVTTTAVCSAYPSCSSYESNYANGRLMGLSDPIPRYITPTTPNKESLFTQKVKVGTNGSGTEELLHGAYLALSAPAVNKENAGFLRQDARLAIVIVSDAADQSPQTVAFYYNFFLNVKGFRRANMVSVSAIIPTQATEPSSSTCSYDESTAGQSTRVRQIVTQTGGFYDEICTPDWSKTLEKVGQIAFGFRTRFFLTNQPDMSVTPDPITVLVDGNPYPAVGPRGDVRWTYNSTATAIDFEPLAVPEPGSTLTVTYHVACLP